jgi:hypothetical protein
MSHDLRAVWETYASAWRAETSAERRALFEACLTPTCVYTDPLTQTRGWDELLAYMASFHEQVPGGHFVTEYFLAHHGRSIAHWKMLNGKGAQLGHGTSCGEYDAQQRLAAMTGFFEVPGASSVA